MFRIVSQKDYDCVTMIQLVWFPCLRIAKMMRQASLQLPYRNERNWD